MTAQKPSPTKDVHDFIQPLKLSLQVAALNYDRNQRKKERKKENHELTEQVKIYIFFLQKIFWGLYQDGIELKFSDMGSHAQSLSLQRKSGFHRHHIQLLIQFHQSGLYLSEKANQILNEPYSGIQPMTAETQ